VGVNHYTWFDSIAAAVPDRTAIALPDRNLSYREVAERVRRLAHVLLDHGLGQVKKPRSDLKGWESGQDHVGLYLYNGREYLEATLGADGARAVPFNVNYRYVEEELTYLLNDADTAALVYHAAFAPTLAAVLPNLKRRPLLLQVSDASGNNLVEGALDYEEALAGASSDPLHTEPSEEDLYILYTGGTTGMPKGTLWTQAAIYSAALAAFSPNSGFSSDTLEHHIEAAVAAAPNVCLPLPPFMHGAAQWMALGCLIGGNTVAIQSKVDTFDPADVWRTVERHKVTALIMVGDAFGRPLCEELDRQTYDTSSLLLLLTGGAVTSPAPSPGRRCGRFLGNRRSNEPDLLRRRRHLIGRLQRQPRHHGGGRDHELRGGPRPRGHRMAGQAG
jgi:acyl-CoA synthetase (AMP-forming)/AMP-acid ligase II